jgi:hypothetical protein
MEAKPRQQFGRAGWGRAAPSRTIVEVGGNLMNR